MGLSTLYRSCHIIVFLSFYCVTLIAGQQVLSAQDSLFNFEMDEHGFWQNNNARLDAKDLDNPEELSIPYDLMRFSENDHPIWRLPEANDFNLPIINTMLTPADMAFQDWKGIGWFRLEIEVEDNLTNKELALIPEYHFGASEIYLNGNYLGGFGRISNQPDKAEYVHSGRPMLLYFSRPGRHVLSIRYANFEAKRLSEQGILPGFRFRIGSFSTHLDNWLADKTKVGSVNLFILGALIAVTLVHLLLFIFYPLQKNNFYFALFTASLSLVSISRYMLSYISDPYQFLIWFKLTDISLVVAMIMALRFSYELFYAKKPIQFNILLILGIILGVYYWQTPYPNSIPLDFFVIVVIAELLRGLVRARNKKKEGYWIIGTGLSAFMLGTTLSLANEFLRIDLIDQVALSGGTGLLIATLSVFLSKNVAGTNIRLRNNIHEIRHLARQKLEQETLTRKKELERKMLATENARKTQELNQARTLQLSMLPSKVPEHPELSLAAHMDTAFEVGGDYYDFHINSKHTLTGVIGDATGHGMGSGLVVATVKSLFVSLSNEKDLCSIMHRISDGIRNMGLKTSFMCLTSYRYKANNNGLFEYCSAGMPPILYWNDQNKTTYNLLTRSMPLGTPRNYERDLKQIQLMPGDCLLILTDGLMELFDKDRHMLGMDKIEEHFLQHAHKSPDEIIKALRTLARSWAAKSNPNDDITMLCIKRNTV